MSWQEFIDHHLMVSGNVNKAAIFSAKHGNLWAGSSGFSPKVEEIQSPIEGFQNTGPIHQNGFHVAGERFVTTHATGRSIYGKKGREGVCAVKTNHAVTVAHYPETGTLTEASKTVEMFADYLISVGY